MRQAEFVELDKKYEELKNLVLALLKVDELMAYEICKLTGQSSKKDEIRKRISAAKELAGKVTN